MNKLIVPAVIVALCAASSDAWSQAASPQATESARREPFVITGDNGGSWIASTRFGVVFSIVCLASSNESDKEVVLFALLASVRWLEGRKM
jgi:hypothetical protein